MRRSLKFAYSKRPRWLSKRLIRFRMSHVISAFTRLNGRPTLTRRSMVFDHGDLHALRSCVRPVKSDRQDMLLMNCWKSEKVAGFVPLVNVTSFAFAGM